MARCSAWRSVVSFLLPPLPPTFEAALRDVHAKNKEARVAAAERLALADQDERARALAALSAQTKDADWGVRSAAVRALTELSMEHALESDAEHALLAAVDDVNPRVRELATIALGRIGGETCGAALERALDSAHPEVRFQALAGYVETQREPRIERVLPLLADPDAEVRGQAARAIATLAESAGGAREAAPKAEPRALAELRALLSDPAPSVRSEAAVALARLGDASGEAQLSAALDQEMLRADALEAMARLGLRSLADQAFRIGRNVFSSPADRVAVARTLFELGDPRGLELLRAALRGLRRAPRALAVAAAGELRLTALLPELLAFIRRPGKVDPETLAEALAAFGVSSPEARAGLEHMAQTPGESGAAARARLALAKRPEQSPPPDA
jgi:HEAT repeat protein